MPQQTPIARMVAVRATVEWTIEHGVCRVRLTVAPPPADARTAAASRLQRFVRHRLLRLRWHQLVIDLVGYNELVRALKKARDEKARPADSGSAQLADAGMDYREPYLADGAAAAAAEDTELRSKLGSGHLLTPGEMATLEVTADDEITALRSKLSSGLMLSAAEMAALEAEAAETADAVDAAADDLAALRSRLRDGHLLAAAEMAALEADAASAEEETQGIPRAKSVEEDAEVAALGIDGSSDALPSAAPTPQSWVRNLEVVVEDPVPAAGADEGVSRVPPAEPSEEAATPKGDETAAQDLEAYKAEAEAAYRAEAEAAYRAEAEAATKALAEAASKAEAEAAAQKLEERRVAAADTIRSAAVRRAAAKRAAAREAEATATREQQQQASKEAEAAEEAAAREEAEKRIRTNDALPSSYFKLPRPLRELLHAAFFYAHAAERNVIREADLEHAALGVRTPHALRAIWDSGAADRALQVHTAYEGLPVIERGTIRNLCERARKEGGMPLLQLISEEPLEMEPTDTALQAFFATECLCSGFELPPEVSSPWLWQPWWDSTLALGSKIGKDFERGLLKACALRGGQSLALRSAVGTSRPTAVKGIAALLGAVVSIDLRDNRITDAETRVIAAAVAEAHALTKLNLAGNRISSAGASELGKALATASSDVKVLAELDVSRNQLCSVAAAAAAPAAAPAPAKAKGALTSAKALAAAAKARATAGPGEGVVELAAGAAGTTSLSALRLARVQLSDEDGARLANSFSQKVRASAKQPSPH